MSGTQNPRRLVLVPMKDPGQCKTRLSGELSRSDRATLARELFRRNLQVLSEIKINNDLQNIDIAVITGSKEVALLAKESGAEVINEGPDTGLNAALSHGAQWAVSRGYDCLLILPADLAAPAPEDLRQLLELPLQRPGIALCPSADLGTNALLASPPDAIPFRYGERSFLRHHAEAEARRLTPRILPLASLRLDIDSSDDLEQLRRLAPEITKGLGK